MALPPIATATPPITITKSDGTTLTVPSPVVTPTTAGVKLFGAREVIQAAVLSQNFYQMIEHFASGTAPTTPIIGQIWYDTTGAGTVKVWDGIAWQSAGGGATSIDGLSDGYYNAANYNLSLGAGGLGQTTPPTIGSCNTAVGAFALECDTQSCSSTAVGTAALRCLTTGPYNTAIGAQSGGRLTTGCYNTAVGTCAMGDGTGDVDNTAIGACTMNSAIGTGCFNTAVGRSAMSTYGGLHNTAVGWNAISFNTSGCYNTGLGSSALGFNQSGCYNTATGYNALSVANNTCYNAAFGALALSCNTTGIFNTAVGYLSMRQNTTGAANVAVGVCAMACNLGGYSNVAVGVETAVSNTTGFENVAVGSLALCSNTSGQCNVAIGQGALSCITAGDNNIALGYNAQVTTATTSNEIRVGNANHTVACVQVAWSVISDMRDKTNVGHVPHGLQFIEQLEPISYQFRKNRDTEDTHGPVRYGFSAQHILAAEGGDLAESVIVHGTEDKLGMTHEYLIPVLVNAVKELSEKVKVLQAELAMLKK